MKTSLQTVSQSIKETLDLLAQTLKIIRNSHHDASEHILTMTKISFLPNLLTVYDHGNTLFQTL